MKSISFYKEDEQGLRMYQLKPRDLIYDAYKTKEGCQRIWSMLNEMGIKASLRNGCGRWYVEIETYDG